MVKINSFKSYRANKQKFTDRQTDTFAKTIFSGSEGHKTWTFQKNGEDHILHKSNTFSDENVKNSVCKNERKNIFLEALFFNKLH